MFDTDRIRIEYISGSASKLFSIYCNHCVTDSLAATIHNGLQVMQQAPNCQEDSWGNNLHDKAGPPQHSTACAANSPIATVLLAPSEQE